MPQKQNTNHRAPGNPAPYEQCCTSFVFTFYGRARTMAHLPAFCAVQQSCDFCYFCTKVLFHHVVINQRSSPTYDMSRTTHARTRLVMRCVAPMSLGRWWYASRKKARSRPTHIMNEHFFSSLYKNKYDFFQEKTTFSEEKKMFRKTAKYTDVARSAGKADWSPISQGQIPATGFQKTEKKSRSSFV